MLPIAKVGVLLVLLGAGATGAYALTGGFGSGSGNSSEETAREGVAENNTVPAPADTPQVAPRSPERNKDNDAGGPEEPRSDTTDLSIQGQGEQGSLEVAEINNDPVQTPPENKVSQDATRQNTAGGKEPGATETDVNHEGDGVDQNVASPNAANVGDSGSKQPREGAEVTLGEEKAGVNPKVTNGDTQEVS